MSDMFGLFDDEDMNELLRKKNSNRDMTVAVKEKPQKLNKETLFHCNRRIEVGTGEYNDFDIEKYSHSLNFYDFEVFKYDWCVVIINPIEKFVQILWNDVDGFKRYYKEHKNEIWVGYNSRNYDVNIAKGLLLDMNPKKINDALIYEGKKGFEISEDFRDIKFYNFDVYMLNTALKELEAFMGNDIRETSVPFDLPRQLTEEEAEQTLFYCRHDVEQTIEVFRRRLEEYDSYMSLMETFELPFDNISLTKAQMTANILKCKKPSVPRNDEFKIQILDTIHLKKYRYVQDWFVNVCKKKDYSQKLETVISGIPHQFGWGGVHGASDKPVFIKGKIFHCDVTSFYPSIMIEYDKLSRNCKNKDDYKRIYDTRVALKKAGKKKEQAPYKIVLNGTYGICKDKYSKAYDPLHANEICVNGQLLLLDLIEHLEGYVELIQSNTDGIIVKVEDNEESIAKFKDICARWCKRTKMGLGNDEIEWIAQKDVNNYIFKFANGKFERKGGYIKETSDLDNDLPIINECIFQYIVNGTSPEDIINNCDNLKEFQKVIRVSSNYKYAVHNNKRLGDKTFRVFASKNYKDTSIKKVKEEGGTFEKFANTPEHCFIWNESVNGVSIPDNLDKKWYVDLAKKRLSDFGYQVDDVSLF